MSAWLPFKEAPKSGMPIIARMADGHEFIVLWTGGYLDSEGNDCGAWTSTEEGFEPDSWTDGVCWNVNDSGNQSELPTDWQPLPNPSPSTVTGGAL